MGKATTGLRAATLVGVGALLLTACGGSDGGTSSTGDSAAQPGGTLRVLSQNETFEYMDPQRNYVGEDLAFTSAFLNRSLTAFTYVEGPEGWAIQGDLATDTGTPNEDASSWSFTLRDGVSFQDGSPVTCEDVKYGVSRTFAQTVITGGPTYAIDYLDIPKDKDGNPVYLGPYETKDNDTAAFDEAVTCSDDNLTITFNLNKPVPDFNGTVSLQSFSPVPKAADTGEKYNNVVVSTGPYQIQEYKPKNQLVLVRNPNWDKASDPIRPAYPDEVVMEFGLDGNTIDQRLISSQGDDTTAVANSDLQSSVLNQVFNDPQLEDRRFNQPDPYTLYIAIDTVQVPTLEHRKALAVCLDRAARRTIAGGDYAGDLADGTIKNNFLGYEPTGMWDGMLGEEIPPEGNVEFGKKLIADSGQPMPPIRYDYSQSPTADKSAASLVESMKRCGIEVTANPIDSGSFYSIILDPAKRGALMSTGWGADWGNASTVVPVLLGTGQPYNFGAWSNKEFDKGVEEASVVLDPEEQMGMWNALNAQSMADVPIIPTLFGNLQRLAGTDVGDAYIWAPYGSWNYGTISIKQ